MKVKNIDGSSKAPFKQPPQGYDSWIAYYKNMLNYSDSKNLCCANIDCSKKNKKIVGAHVRKVDSNDKKWYIVPLCISCNGISSCTEIDIGNTNMVAVNS